MTVETVPKISFTEKELNAMQTVSQMFTEISADLDLSEKLIQMVCETFCKNEGDDLILIPDCAQKLYGTQRIFEEVGAVLKYLCLLNGTCV